MTYDNVTSYKGNIETATQQCLPVGAVFKVDGGGYLDLDELDGAVTVSPAIVVESDVSYDYTSLTKKVLRKVSKYKFQWELEFIFISKSILDQLKYLEELWEMKGHTFGATGVRYKQKILFTPEGEEHRVPNFEVVKISEFKIAPKYFGGRLIGHAGVKWLIETVQEYPTKRLPSVPLIITTMPTMGVLGRGWAMPDKSIFT